MQFTETNCRVQASRAKPALNDRVALAEMVAQYRSATPDELAAIRPDIARQIREGEAQALTLGRYPVFLCWPDFTEVLAFLTQPNPTPEDLLAAYLKARLGGLMELSTIASAVAGTFGGVH
jgi:hypothetical protein